MVKLSFIEAAYQILKENGNPLSAEEMTKVALAKELIETSGKTPTATMSARIYMDIKRGGKGSLFIKAARGIFGLKEWGQQNQAEQLNVKIGGFKDAAYQVLKSANKPLRVQDITTLAKRQDLLTTKGKTPEATMGAQLYTDIKNLGNQSRFVQLGKNRFGLRGWGIEVLSQEIKEQESEKEILFPGKKRSIVGDPINFEGLIYSPLNENGVIFLFSKLHDKLGINIESIQIAYPDAKGRRKTSKGWEDVWIEFEYKSSHFKAHKHDSKGCDIIVCWEHDWKQCPLEVIELKKIINKPI
jgi:DNA-directed RNA polymerase delta subunit